MTDTETDLRRPSSAAYHAGPWKTDMRMRQVHDANDKPTGQWMFLHSFLYWSSVEVIIRSEMRRTLLAWWGCAR